VPTRDEARRNRWLRWLGPLLERKSLWRVNRRGVATGAALGVFFGLILPVGQIRLAAAGAFLLRANLPAAALGTLVSNPFTVAPIYWLAYQSGAALIAALGPDWSRRDDAAAFGVEGHRFLLDWLQHMADWGAPLALGLALFAATGALLTYVSVRLLWRFGVRRFRRRKRAFNA